MTGGGCRCPRSASVLPELLASGDAEAFHADTWEAALTGRSDVPDATRERIVAAAVDLFAARGYGDVAVSDVAARAGTAKGSVYRHFESKEALFAAAVESVVAGVVADVRAAADRAGGQLEPTAAMVTLVMSATPGFMLLLELTAGSLRGQPGHRELADAALTCFVDGVGPVLAGTGDATRARRRAHRAVGAGDHACRPRRRVIRKGLRTRGPMRLVTYNISDHRVRFLYESGDWSAPWATSRWRSNRRAPRPGPPCRRRPELLAQADHENFPVATRLLPRAAREHLLAVYGFARLTDDIGDETRATGWRPSTGWRPT